MASRTYNALCDEIYEEILEKLERKNDDRRRFATRGTAKKVLHRDNLLRFFRTLLLSDGTARGQSKLTEEDLVARVNERQLHDFLAILIFATCGFEAASTFIIKLVANDAWPVRDARGKIICSLPADREALIELFGNVVTADKFFTKQACFCTAVIRKREELRVEDVEAQRLPYLEEQPLAKGSFGKVFKVKIAKGHFFDPQTRTANVDAEDMARKDYLIGSGFRVSGEREIMEKILTSSGRRCENILENYGALEIGTSMYSLFMPLAICDLRAYMMEHHRARPNTTMEKAKIILSAEGLAGGLNFLHNEMKTSDMEDLVCYHMDLKPNNILIFREKRDGETRNIWKLSDFGMSRVKIRRRGQDGEREKDFDSWFVRRRRPQDPSLSATLNRRGEGTYLAPESISSTRSMKAESDVWSLACVISVVFAYLEEGSEGVARYQEARMQHTNADGYDRFFLRGRGFTPTKVHPVVTRWHTHLIDKASQRDSREGNAVRFMLRYLEDAVFEINQFKRRGAKEVQEMLLETFKKYRSLQETGRDQEPGGKQSKPLGKALWEKMRPRSGLAVDRQVEEWYLSASEAFKGCEISPDGTLVVYWTDIKISLYTAQSLSSGDENVVTPAAEYSLERTDCIWKSIGLTQRYLIASTTGGNFQCYIFDLERGPSVDASLDHWYRVALPRPEINKLAISPDNQTLACILRGKEEDQNPGSLFLAPISELIKIAKTPPSTSTDGTSSGGSAGNTSNTSGSERWSSDKLDWPAADVTHLSFPTSEDIYIVVRPELTVKSREHKIPIVHLCLRTKTMETLIIESRGLDTSSTSGLFTTFAPLRHDASTCAVVTREKTLHIQKLTTTGTDDDDDDDATPAMRHDIRHYRVQRLMAGSAAGTMFAVGRTSANNRMLLLELSVPRSSDAVAVRELAVLPGLAHDDEFTERLAGVGGEAYVLIAALVGANRRAIYRVRVPGLEGGRR